MTGEERRSELLNFIQSAGRPVSGAALADRYQVSRQVIVQDIALLRAANYNILSTSKGYMMQVSTSCTRVFQVSHTDEQIADELNTIVDMGGRVLDVFIHHAFYGSLKADLLLSSRRDINEFLESLKSGKSKPLKNLTSGSHYHTVEAESMDILNIIANALDEKGYLVAD